MAPSISTTAADRPAPGTPGELPAPGTPGIRRRRPLGPVLPNKRTKGAVRLANSDTGMIQAQSEYQEAIYAPGTLNTKAALRKTWAEIAQAREWICLVREVGVSSQGCEAFPDKGPGTSVQSRRDQAPVA